MSVLVIIVLGFLAGAILSALMMRMIFHRNEQKEAIGTLQIIEMKGEVPHLFLSLDMPVESFSNRPVVIMSVSHKRVSPK